MGFFSSAKLRMPTKEDALPGRAERMPVAKTQTVKGTPMEPPFAATQVGYAAGLTPNPTYREVCSGQTGYNEVVRVGFDPKVISYDALLKVFWESHDPTQGMQQGGDVGTQYRSGIYCFDAAQKKTAEESKAAYGKALAAARHGAIATEILDAPEFFYAEDYHQQYLDKNPDGYCGLGGTGVACPVGLRA